MKRISGTPYLSDEEIEFHASETRLKAIRSGVKDEFPFDAESTVELAFQTETGEGYSLVLGCNMPPKVLGSTIWQSREVRISKDVLDNPGRTRFTVAHEIGHIVLHVPRLIARHDHQVKLLDMGNEIHGDKRMEVQADKFAAEFLMPKQLVLADFGDAAHRGEWIDPQVFSQRYGVSIQAAKYRIEALGLTKRTSAGLAL